MAAWRLARSSRRHLANKGIPGRQLQPRLRAKPRATSPLRPAFGLPVPHRLAYNKMFIGAYVGARPLGRPLPPLSAAPCHPAVPLHLLYAFARDADHDGVYEFYGKRVMACSWRAAAALLCHVCRQRRVSVMWNSSHACSCKHTEPHGHHSPLCLHADPYQLEAACSQQCSSQRGMLSLAGAGFAWGLAVPLDQWVANAAASLQALLDK